MEEIGIWSVTGRGPARLAEAGVSLEQHLEEWIERDPGLVRSDLTIIGRQVSLESGRLDLLALDPQGRLVVIEIKSGVLRRETLAQAIDYASSLGQMSLPELAAKVDPYLKAHQETAGHRSFLELLAARGAEDEQEAPEREVEICVVGTGTAPGLERMITYLAERYGVPASVVLFKVFALPDGQQVLVRALEESEGPPDVDRGPDRVDQIVKLAERSGVGSDFLALLNTAQKHGLYARPYKRSIMYTPPSNKTRMLFTVWVQSASKPGLRLWPSAEAFAEFYPVSVQEAVQILGESGGRDLRPGEADTFVQALHRFFDRVGEIEGS